MTERARRGSGRGGPRLTGLDIGRFKDSGPALVLDTRAKVLAANRPALRHLDRKKADVIGASLSRLFPRPVARKWKQALETVVETGLPGKALAEHRDRYLEATLLPVLDTDGRTARVALLVRDVTEERQRAARAALLASEWQQTFDSVTDIVALIAPDFRLLRVNRAGCEGLGKSEDQLIGQKCYKVVHGTSCPVRGCPCQQALKTKTALSAEFSEHGRHFIATAAPILDDHQRVVAFTHTVKDITYRKLAENELARHRERLAELVEERTRELHEAQEEAARQEKLAALGRVASELARELRTPLGDIRSNLHALRPALPRLPMPGVPPRLSAIETSVDRMELAVTALLDYVRRTESSPTACALAGIVSRALVQSRLPDNIEVHVELASDLPRVYADERRMVAVFANIIANAARAVPEGGVIDVYAASTDGRVTVVVSDTGAGMTPELTSRLFEPLFSSREGGGGLGLAVAKAFVEADGGALAVSSAKDKGTSLIVTLPVAVSRSRSSR